MSVVWICFLKDINFAHERKEKEAFVAVHTVARCESTKSARKQKRALAKKCATVGIADNYVKRRCVIPVREEERRHLSTAGAERFPQCAFVLGAPCMSEYVFSPCRHTPASVSFVSRRSLSLLERFALLSPQGEDKS